jgi:nucleotide-binding universal stress UspA family protein
MKFFPSILVVFPPQPPKATLKRLVLNSLALAQWMESEVHFLPEMSDVQSVETAIHEFGKGDQPCPPSLILNQSSPESGQPIDRVAKIMEKDGCSLIVMVDGVLLDSNKGTDERRILELSSKPILMLPKDFNFAKEKTHSFIVPISGETRANEALSVSLHLALQTHSLVDLVHVATSDGPRAAHEDLDALGDQMHHEYNQMAEKIVTEASPFSTLEERARVRRVFHCTGSIVSEITKLIRESPELILTLQWRGTFAAGRAETIKDILQKVHCPILFVKTTHEEKSTLRVGSNLRAA